MLFSFWDIAPPINQSIFLTLRIFFFFSQLQNKSRTEPGDEILDDIDGNFQTLNDRVCTLTVPGQRKQISLSLNMIYCRGNSYEQFGCVVDRRICCRYRSFPVRNILKTKYESLYNVTLTPAYLDFTCTTQLLNMY